jgi:lysozyme
VTQRTSDRCKAFLKTKEHCVLQAYPDPLTGGKPYTCGWGSTRGVTKDTVWTQEQADAAFEVDVAEAEAAVRRYVTHEMTQGQFDAFVSIFYNVGPGSSSRDGIGRLKSGRPSTLLRKFNDGDIAGAEAEWPKWCSPGSNVERGLRKRRYEELAMFRGEEP